ncbi:MAG: ABC transporter ATP-binding protein/permease [Desulfobulbaceae bacterium]|jgi:ABC-type multidrug transport system fused ATPase/permease subunit|nr:ABC transporter ATP-binding protein/permease [Desulfobulbaceae bacterium]
MRSFSHLFTLFRDDLPGRRIVVLLIALSLTENGVGLLIPWLAGRLTQTLSGGSLTFRPMLALIFFCLCLQSLISYGNRVLSARAAETMVSKTRNHLYDHLQALPLAYFINQKPGATLSLLSQDCMALSAFLTNSVIAFVPIILTACGALLCLALISPAVAAVVAAMLPLTALILKILGRKTRPRARAFLDNYAALMSLAEENLANIPLIKSFCRERAESAEFAAASEALLRASKGYYQAQALLAPTGRLLAVATLFVVLFFLGDAVAVGAFTAGELVSMALYAMLLAGPVSRLADMYGSLQHALSAADRLNAVFRQQTEPYGQGIDFAPNAVRGAISIEDLRFAWPGRPEILRGLNCRIEAGETVVITGENGAGKSTLTALLLRFIEPDSGRIRLDGHDLPTLSLTALRRQIGLVQQHILLKNASVAENIIIGGPNASEAQMRQAARAANALEFIEKLPRGFDTAIGDKGIKLSGGQKQRLALARALLKDPPILILDEPTAMFDPEGERQFIEENLEKLQGKTVIIITHRPAALSLADRVLCLENGILLETRQS